MTKKVLIVAPHIDDELIGCWSVLNNRENEITILWLYEITVERKAESAKLGYVFPSVERRIYNPTIDKVQELFKEEFDEVYVPSRRDTHLDHKHTNADYRKYATKFYSVDMHDGQFLGDAYSKKKLDALNFIYPSQAKLWENNAKYYLFESIHDKDYQDLVTIEWYGYTITVSQSNYSEVRNYLQQLEDTGAMRKYSHIKVFEDLLTLIPIGKVRIVSHSSILETF